MGVVGSEHGDATAIDGPERGAGVREALPDDRETTRAKSRIPKRRVSSARYHAGSRESRADHNVSQTVEDGAEDRQQLTGVVLPSPSIWTATSKSFSYAYW